MSALPRIHDLPAAEKRAAYSDAMERVADASREIIAENKARKPDPRSVHDYRAWNTMRMVCILVVRSERPFPASFECTKDGPGARIFLPKSKTIVLTEATPEFLLAVVPKWLAEKAGLMGVAPDLAGDWSDTQREAWKSLTNLRLGINSKIHFAKKRPASLLTRRDVA